MEGKYMFYVASARGTILRTTCLPNEKILYEKSEVPSKVTAFSYGRHEDELIVGYESGKVSLYDCSINKFSKKTVKNLEGSGNIVGIGCIDKLVVIGKCDGIINLWNGKKTEYFNTDLDENSTLDALSCNSNRINVIGTGGEQNCFKLWNVETQQCIFKAKSLGNDELNLSIPTSIRSITFFPEENISSCATKEGLVLLYDDRAQRKPIVKFQGKNVSYTTISSAFRERQCFVGTTRGYMQLLDLRSNKSLKTFTSFTGSVTSITCDPVEPYVASTSLDRFFRIHNIETKQLVHKIYMKQNLTRVLIKPVVKEEKEEILEEKEAIDAEYEEIFNNMETVQEVSEKSLKRKSLDKIKKIKKKKIKESNKL